MVALATGAAAVNVRRAEEMAQARREAEERERRRREEARQQRAKIRQTFLTTLADEYAAYAKLATFAPVILYGSTDTGAEPVDRLGRVLRETLATMRRRFERESLNVEIERLALFGDGDPA